MKNLLTILTLALLPSLAMAQTDPRAMFSGNETVLDDIALNAAAATRTFTVTDSGQGYKLLVLTLDHTNNSSTDVGMTCTASPDGGTTLATLQSCSTASGACTSNDASWTKAVTGDKVWPWRVDVLGFKQVKCVITSTSAAASDKLTVIAYFTTN